MKVYWGRHQLSKGGISPVRDCSENGPYAYYHLLSGADLPIKSQDYIHEFFHKNSGKEFVGFWQDAAHQRDLERKVSRYYFSHKD